VKVRYGTTTLNETRYLSEAEHQLSFDYDCRFELGRSGLHGKLYAIVAWALGHFGPGFIEYPFRRRGHPQAFRFIDNAGPECESKGVPGGSENCKEGEYDE